MFNILSYSLKKEYKVRKKNLKKVIDISLKLAILAAGESVSLFYKEQLEYFFGDAVAITAYSIENGSVFSPKNEDVYLVTTVSFECNEDILKYIPKDKHIIIGDVTFKNSTINRLKEFPINTKALLVNSSPKMASETITLLYKKGVNNIQFFPYYPNSMETYSDIDIAITPGETRYIPNQITNILDIQNRVLDRNTLIEIATTIGCDYLLDTKRFTTYFDEISNGGIGIETLIEKNSILRQQISTITKSEGIGVIEFDVNEKIQSCNNLALNLLDEDRSNLLFKVVQNIVLKEGVRISKKTKNIFQTIYKNKKEEQINLLFIPIIKNDNVAYTYCLIRKNKDMKRENEIENEYLKRGHYSRYTFSDIITEDNKLIKTKEMAKKMAKMNAAILITGESGTGKELFAHSIHNASERRELPFVALNCAALNESILESELFGYEEGAFTGAKKGGKIGLFEIANNGTIFLDEIEGMSQTLQLKLLRVLQEKEIIRVGGDKLISIDVRVIAATNENILSLVKEKKFRTDLYYRLNALPINILPLRERIGDLEVLINYFKKNLDLNFIFTEKAKKLIFQYNWPGNIRELKNCMEYFCCLNEKIIETTMLPEYIKENIDLKEDKDQSNNFLLILEILNILKKSEKNEKGIGRSYILKCLKEKDFEISESIIRRLLQDMNKKGYIISTVGRGGSKITQLGKEISRD